MSHSHSQQIDLAKGHAFLHNGVIYYSPNSTRPINVPDRPGPSSRYRFRNKDAIWQRFHDPQWWTLEYCFLSFVPLRPSFEGDTFGTLRDILPFVVEGLDGLFGLETKKITQWRQLEDWLFYVSALLDQTVDTYPAMKPIPPSFLGFEKRFKSERSARLRATISRDWFIVCMGLLSFKIAAVSSWFNVLAEKGVPQIWLNDLQFSTACNFSESCPRVGIILDWLNPAKKQPPVEWFTAHHVPVWYPWTRDHEVAARNPRLSDFRPPGELLQMATTLSPIPPPSQTVIASSVSPPSKSSEIYFQQQMKINKEFNAARKSYIMTKPWAAFFEARSKAEAELQTETPQQRQRRLNREKQRPIVSSGSEAYEWVWSQEDPLILVRTRLRKSERQEIVESYEINQRRYDSFKDEWDVCHYFGSEDDCNTPDSDDEETDNISERWGEGSDWNMNEGGIEEDNDDYDVQREQASHSEYISTRLNQLSASDNPISWPTSQFRSEIEVDLTGNLRPFEILEHLQLFYGYIPPLNKNSSSWTRNDWDDSIKTIGWYAGDKNPPLKEFEAIVIQFVKDFCSPKNFPPKNCDLHSNNYRAITLSDLKKVFRLMCPPDNKILYIISEKYLKDGEACPYSITLTDARDALFVYRLLGVTDFTAISLCEFLLENGITFRTLQHLEHIHSTRTLNNDSIVLPMRLSYYLFGPNDYEAYVRHRAQLLTSPRGRAALLRGGIISRIAREHISIDSALFGPSSAVTVHRLGSYVTKMDGKEFWDDDLTDNEIGIICGVHRCFTGMPL